MRLSVTFSDSEIRRVEAIAKASGLSRTDYVRQQSLGRIEGTRLDAGFYRDTVESCARLIALPRPQLEALVGLVITRVKSAESTKN
jgi:hypothetical protein